MKTRPKKQYHDNDAMNNYVERNNALVEHIGEGRTESTIYPKGCTEGRNPVIKGDEKAMGAYGAEQKVGDHHEYA